MSTTATNTFEISNVKLATEPLPEVPYKHAVQTQIKTGNSQRRLRETLTRHSGGQSTSSIA